MTSVLFRADASLVAGSGHVMRCLTLADRLSAMGCSIAFVCREQPGHMLREIDRRGYEGLVLPAAGSCGAQADYASWLGVTSEADAEATLHVIGQKRFDWLVVDNYALGSIWEQALRQNCRRVLAIDDLANRAHDCDLLLDQNLGRHARDYDGLVPDHCRRMIGPDNALLRPEFALLREASLARRVEPEFKHLLIGMGGVDQHNASGAILDVWRDHPLSERVAATVVLGRAAPHRADLEARARSMSASVRLLIDVPDVASLMADADLAIGAAGGSTWERCCLGLPTLLITIAENQRPAADAMQVAGAAMLVDDYPCERFSESLMAAIDHANSGDWLRDASKAAASLCSGGGAASCAMAMMELGQT